MRRLLLTAAALVAVSLLLPGAGGATTIGKGTPKGKLAALGYHLYGEYCLSCHGSNAAGRSNEPSYAAGFGPLRTVGQQGGIAPSLHGVGALAADFYLRTGYMPLPHVGLQPRRTRQVLDNHSIKALIAYVATFGGPPIPHPQPQKGNLSEGQSLFTEHCAGCHQVVAQGGYVTGAVPPPLVEGGVTATQVAELNSIIRYVLWAKSPHHPGGWGINFLGPVPEGLVTWFIALPVLLGFCIVLGRRLKS
jgi:ubiquinol-cytochrome c reductase cytochrome c subunit